MCVMRNGRLSSVCCPRTQTHKGDLGVVEHPGKGFQVVKHHWKVERTFAWLLNDRRHSRDYEVLTANSEALIQISMIRLLLKRPA
jgi:putative transposase